MREPLIFHYLRVVGSNIPLPGLEGGWVRRGALDLEGGGGGGGGGPLKILETGLLLGQAPKNSWDKPAIGTCPL